MLSIVSVWICAIILSYITGVLVLSLLRIATGRMPRDADLKTLLSLYPMTDTVFAGVIVLTVYAQVYSLFAGTSSAIGHLSLFCLTWALILILRYLKLNGFQADLHTLRALLPEKRRLIIGVIIFLAMAYGTSHGIEHYDTGLYHAQAIRWISEIGIMKGLGNLHTRLAYNSAAMAFSALFSEFNAGHAMAGFMALLLAWKVVRKTVSGVVLGLPLVARLLGAYYLFMIYDEMVSPAPDFFVNCVLLYIVISWLDATEQDADDHTYALLCVAAVFAVTLKLSVAPLLGLTVYAVYKLKKPRNIAVYLLAGTLVIAPFLIRNYYLSGYLVYPFPSLDLFDVPWKIPQGVAAYDAREIAVYGRGYTDVTRYAEPRSIWFDDWFQSLGPIDARMFIAARAMLFGLLIMGFFVYVRWREKRGVSGERENAWLDRNLSFRWLKPGVFTLLVVLELQFYFWFNTAPLVRYGKMILWLPAVLGVAVLAQTMAERFITLSDKIKRIFATVAIVLFFGYKSAMLIRDELPRADVRWLTEQQPYAEFALEPYREILYGVLMAPTDGDRVGEVLLASPNRENVEVLGEYTDRLHGYLHPKNGFRATKDSAEEQ